MFVIPAIELRGGAATRSSPADDVTAPVMREHPLELVRALATAGFHRVQVVDLDARSGGSANSTLVDTLLRDGACELQIEARIDSTDEIERLVEAGAARIVLGPRALEDDSWLVEVAELYPGLLIVATDVRQRRVVKRGWVRTLPLDIFDFLETVRDAPLGGLLVASVGQDAAFGAVDLALLEDIAEASEAPVITRGGVFDTADLRALEHRGISAAVVGEPLRSDALNAWSVAQEFG